MFQIRPGTWKNQFTSQNGPRPRMQERQRPGSDFDLLHRTATDIIHRRKLTSLNVVYSKQAYTNANIHPHSIFEYHALTVTSHSSSIIRTMHLLHACTQFASTVPRFHASSFIHTFLLQRFVNIHKNYNEEIASQIRTWDHKSTRGITDSHVGSLFRTWDHRSASWITDPQVGSHIRKWDHRVTYPHVGSQIRLWDHRFARGITDQHVGSQIHTWDHRSTLYTVRELIFSFYNA